MQKINLQYRRPSFSAPKFENSLTFYVVREKIREIKNRIIHATKR